MKNKGLLLIFLLFVSHLLHSQSTGYWDTILYSGGNHSEIIELDSTYLTVVRGVETSKLQLWLLNNEGKIIDSNEIDFGAVIQNCGGCMVKHNSNSILYAHTLFQSLQDGGIQFLKLNHSLDTIMSTKYLFQDSLATFIKHMKLIDGDLYFTGYVYYHPNRYELLLGCMDTSFNVLWEESYFRNFSIGGFWGYDVEQTSDGGFLLSGINTNFPSNTYRKGLLLKTDSLGSESWRKTLNYPSGIMGGQLYIEKNANGSMYYAGAQDLSNGLQQLRFGSVSHSGVVLFDTLIGDPVDLFGTSSMVLSQDQNFVIAGSTFHQKAQGMAFKFDQYGNSVWQRYYHTGEHGERSEIYTTSTTSDTGIVMAGTYYDQINNPGSKVIYHWVKKVDKHGCEMAGCNDMHYGWEEIMKPSIQIYPNPTRGFINVNNNECCINRIRVVDPSGLLLAEYKPSNLIELPLNYKGVLIIEVHLNNVIYREVILKI